MATSMLAKFVRRHHPNRATLYDHNPSAGAFKYSVDVKDAATGQVLMVDPMINNEP